MTAHRGSLSLGEGLEAVTGGIGFILGTPRLWGHALVPVALLLVLSCGLGGLGVWGAGWAGGAFMGDEPSWWGQVGGWLLTLVVAVAALFVALLLALALAQPLSCPALEAIALAQEVDLLGEAPVPPSFVDAILGSLRVALVTMAVGAATFGLLFLAGLLFPPAVAVTLPLKFLAGAWLLAWTFLDYPLGLRGLGISGRLNWVGRNFGAFTAFGAAWALLLVVPGVFFLVLPMGVAGATRLVVADQCRSVGDCYGED